MPAGSDAVVIVIGDCTFSEKLLIAAWPVVSATRTVMKLKLTVVGVPEIRPFGASVNPGGRLPPNRVHVVPGPEAVSCSL